MKRYVAGDIHGAFKAFKQVLELSKFDYDNDQLICLGDVADSWSGVPETFDELLKIKNLIYIIGNHDYWLMEWFKTRFTPHIWTSQGGKATLDAYEGLMNMGEFDRMDKHQQLLEHALYKYVSDDNKLFVHGGFQWHAPMDETPNQHLMWDRHLWESAEYWQRLIDKDDTLMNTEDLRIKEFDEVFIGHTTTSRHHPDLKPVHASNVWNLDQGCGWEGKLTLMNIDTHEYFQSDLVSILYPNEHGR